jgi:glutamate-1-semialdehyde 2,1-aminomutase
MAAGIATLDLLDVQTYVHLERLGARLCEGFGRVFAGHDIPHAAAAVGSMFGFFLTAGPVTDLMTAKRADTALYARFFHAMLDRGYYFAPSQFEAAFLSLAHTEAEIDRTIDAAADALAEVHACR